MAKMRVHELAKEFGISSKEMLEKLKEMNIPAKNHASTLVDAYVDKIRKKLGPELLAAQEAAAAEEAAKEEAAKEEAAKEEAAKEETPSEVSDKPADEEAAKAEEKAEAPATVKASEEPKKAAESKESKESESQKKSAEPKKPAESKATKTAAKPKADEGETGKTASAKSETAKSKQAAAGSKTSAAAHAEKPAAKAKAATAKSAEAESHTSTHQAANNAKPKTTKAKTAETAASKEAKEAAAKKEEERIQREKDKAARDKELAARAAEKAERGEVDDSESADQAAPKKKVLKATPAKGKFDSLLSQIEAEKDRLDKEKSGATEEKKASPSHAAKKPHTTAKKAVEAESEIEPAQDDSKKGKKPKKAEGKQHKHNQVETADSDEGEENDRYKKMAAEAEKMQRQKIFDEARTMVDAAQSEGQGRRKKRKEKREAQAKKRVEEEAIERGIDPELLLDDSVVQIATGATVAELSEALGVNSSEVIKKLFLLGTPLTVTQTMSDDLIELIADDMGRKIRIVSPEEQYEIAINDTDEDLTPRPPVVTVMGHVDHGKTSLLDAIRNTGVVATEAGGITQAIGASVVKIDDRQITFIDTPGHEAFTAMRARGAKITDVVVLVVAADDGVMPQTIEAINHSKAAGVPIVVAVNKIDKPGASPDKVRQELTEYGIVPEEWGGENMFVDVSAKKNLNIDELLETILLQADVLELKANPDALSSGFVIEGNLDKGRGPVATVLVQRGTLKVGDAIVAGTAHGRVRALINPKGEHVDEAKPADPVEVLGLGSVPAAGDEFRVFEDERDARNLAEDRALRERLKDQQSKVPVTLDDFFNRIEEGKIAELNLVVKADTQGSIEALKDAFDKMDQTEVHINVIHSAVGGVTETDVILAAASDAIIIGFGVRPQSKAKQLAEKEQVDIRTYRVIYKAIEEINAARVGLLKPDIVEKETATIDVRDTFKVPKVGTIAGCFVQDGEVGSDDKIRVVRDGTIIHEGEIASLRRFKDDVKSVRAGYECGIGIEGFQDIHVGDVLESYKMVELAREA